MTNSTILNPIDLVLDKLDGVKPTGQNQWQARCPSHDDKNPSLGVNVCDDGKVLMCCHAGCEIEAVVDAMGLTMSDLEPTKATAWQSPFVRDVPAVKSAQKKTFAKIPTHWKNEPIDLWYTYRNSDSEILYKIGRTESKQFPCISPVAGGWQWGRNGTAPVLYRLDDFVKTDSRAWTLICEGERDVESLICLGQAATCNPGGAGKWRPEYNQYFIDRHVVLTEDNDKVGRDHVNKIANALHGIAADIRIIRFVDQREKYDISDWISDGGNVEKLYQLVDKTKPFELTDDPKKSKCVTVTVGNVAPEPVEWLWWNRIPQGKLTIIGGDPGVGKSFMSLSITAHISAGIPFSDTPDCSIEPGKVILLSAEDDIADTIRPRLDAMGADCSNIIAIKAIKQGEKECSFDLGLHVHELESTIIQAGNVKLCVIDPVSAFIGTERDGHSNTQIRGILSPLSDLAAKYKVAIVCITHLNKNSSNNSAIYRLMGSLAWSAAARAVWGVVKDTQDTEDVLYSQQRRLMLPIKCNLSVDAGTGLGFTIQDGAVVWDITPIQQSAQDFYDKQYQNQHQRGRQPSARDAAIEWLKAALQDGPLWSDTVKEKARRAGISKNTLERAKKEAGVMSDQSNSRHFYRFVEQVGEVPNHE